MDKGFSKIGHRPTLPPVTAVPLALAGLTSLFGMGRGGHRRYRHLKILELSVLSFKFYVTYNVLPVTYNLKLRQLTTYHLQLTTH